MASPVLKAGRGTSSAVMAKEGLARRGLRAGQADKGSPGTWEVRSSPGRIGEGGCRECLRGRA